MDKRVVVTGMGVSTSNATCVDEFYTNSKNGKCGIEKCILFDTDDMRTNYVGEIKKKMPYMVREPKEKRRYEYIAESVIDELFEDSEMTKEQLGELDDRAALVFSTLSIPCENMLSYVTTENSSWLPDIPFYSHFIKEYCGINGSCYFCTAACAAGTTAAGIAYDLICKDRADIVVVGGIDPLSEYICAGFDCLRALSKSICKPFDVGRDGTNIGEAGGFLLFEEVEHAKKRNAKIYAEILGYGINNDAYHITKPDPEGLGAIASMKMALNEGEIDSTQIDLINAHGTGTPLNDSMEITALKALFSEERDQPLYVYTNKGMIGHCMGSAGIVELIATVISIKEKIVFPNIKMQNKIDNSKLVDLVNESKEADIHYALSNSFAFAGNTASILVGEWLD